MTIKELYKLSDNDELWVCVEDVQCDFPHTSKLSLIDSFYRGKIVRYNNKEYKIIIGRYGNCSSYPNGFDILIKKI